MSKIKSFKNFFKEASSGKEYIAPKDSDDEVKGYKPRSKGEEDFANAHNVTKHDYPADVDDQFTGNVQTKPRQMNNGEQNPVDQGSSKTNQPKGGGDSKRQADKTDGDKKMPTVKEEVDLEEAKNKNPFKYYKKPSNKKEAQSNVNYWHYEGMLSTKDMEDMGKIPANYKSFIKTMKHEAEKDLKKFQEEVDLEEAKMTDAKNKEMMRKALGVTRLAPKHANFTTSYANNGDFVVRDGAGRVVGRIAKGELNEISKDLMKKAFRARADRLGQALNKYDDGDKSQLKKAMDQEKKLKKTSQAMDRKSGADKSDQKDFFGKRDDKRMQRRFDATPQGKYQKYKDDGGKLSFKDYSAKYMREEVELDEAVIDDLKNIVKNKSAKDIKLKDGKKMKVDMFTASAMTQVYDALNDANKKKFADAIEKNETMFMKMMDFAMSKVK